MNLRRYVSCFSGAYAVTKDLRMPGHGRRFVTKDWAAIRGELYYAP